MPAARRVKGEVQFKKEFLEMPYNVVSAIKIIAKYFTQNGQNPHRYAAIFQIPIQRKVGIVVCYASFRQVSKVRLKQLTLLKKLQ